jgi:alkylation response protein AidB-like acyl-CoA dehydrogenase
MILDLSPHQIEYRDRVRAFARAAVAPQAAAIDERDRLPIDLIREAARQGLAGVSVPPEWGGAGEDRVCYALAIEELAYASASLAVALVVNNSLVAEPLARFGTPGQRAAWLRRLATGEALGAFALSEPEAGTDVAHLRTTALLEPGGGGYRVSGRKVWVANAGRAEVVLVFAMTEARGGSGVTAFLVPLDAPGIERGARNEALGVRGLECFDLGFDNVRVESGQVLGAVGEGFGVIRWALVGGRMAIAAQAVGLAQAALDQSVAHARVRRSFGQPIASYEAIQWMLADSATDIEAARTLTWKAATIREEEPDAMEAASMAKLFASETACRASDRAMQIFASEGYRRGSIVERLFRDARASEIYQGTSEVQRMIIAAHVLRQA